MSRCTEILKKFKQYEVKDANAIIFIIDKDMSPMKQYLVKFNRKGDREFTPDKDKAHLYTRSKAKQVKTYLKGFGYDDIFIDYKV